MEHREFDEVERRWIAAVQSYRAACPEAEPRADFMPRLWQRIEERRGYTQRLRLFARGILAGASCLSLLLIALAMPQGSGQSALVGDDHFELLAGDSFNTAEDMLLEREASQR